MPRDLSLGSLRAAAGESLSGGGAADPLFEADQILSHVLKKCRASLHAHPEETVTEEVFGKILGLAVRRGAGEPLAYVLGDAIFGGRTFSVDRRVLIPRPETEALLEWADRTAKGLPEPGVFADWCTGSGCIAISLLLDNPGWRGFAVDSSEDALEVARGNALAAGVSDRLTFLRCDQPAGAGGIIPPHSLDMIVANPPYIPSGVIPTLEVQVRGHEPREALDGGPDGLDICRLLLAQTPRFLKNGAALAFETGGEAQVDSLASESPAGMRHADSFTDGLGIRRFIVWKRES